MSDPTVRLEKDRHSLHVAAVEYARAWLIVDNKEHITKGFVAQDKRELFRKELALETAAMEFVISLERLKKDYV